jgi:hypothetical protein
MLLEEHVPPTESPALLPVTDEESPEYDEQEAQPAQWLISGDLLTSKMTLTVVQEDGTSVVVTRGVSAHVQHGESLEDAADRLDAVQRGLIERGAITAYHLFTDDTTETEI